MTASDHRDELRRICEPEQDDGPFLTELKDILRPAADAEGRANRATRHGFELHRLLEAVERHLDDDTEKAASHLEAAKLKARTLVEIAERSERRQERVLELEAFLRDERIGR